MTQREMIIDHLRRHGSITPKEALEKYGIMRLGARIWDIQNKDGIVIETAMKRTKNRFGKTVFVAEYKLPEGGAIECRKA